jgi:hypothetical protein
MYTTWQYRTLVYAEDHLDSPQTEEKSPDVWLEKRMRMDEMPSPQRHR